MATFCATRNGSVNAWQVSDSVLFQAGANYDITVVSDVFEGMRPVKKQQTVYAALRDAIAAGSIHAVNIRTFTRDEWEARGA